MARFLTGLITTDYWRYPPFPYRGRHWSLDLLETERSRNHQEQPVFLEDPNRPVRGQKFVGREVVIDALTDAAARRAAFLLLAAGELTEDLAAARRLGFRIELCDQEKLDETDPEDYRRRAFICTRDIPLLCMIALKAARKSRWAYALSKLWLSRQLFYVDMMDLDPGHSPTIPKSLHLADHVAYAHAIVLAYAAIEELKLEMRASAEQPSMKYGKWNPPVRAELEERLVSAGVNLKEPFSWNIRGPKTTLEVHKPPRVIQRESWAYGDVRDAEVEVVDAIAHVSWLRSKVSAHRLNPRFARVLSAYDVSNAQHLACRLILETLGFWSAESD